MVCWQKKQIRSIITCGLIIGLALCGSAGCSPKTESGERIVVKVNDYNITLGEFRSRLAQEAERYHDFTLDQESRSEFLKELIKKEVLIQEAISLDLNRSEKFIKTIERHWEATLIRTLLEMKGEEINRQILVSREEIEAYYDSREHPTAEKQLGAAMEKKIVRLLKEKKKTRQMAEWIRSIEARAVIEIDEELLSNL